MITAALGGYGYVASRPARSSSTLRSPRSGRSISPVGRPLPLCRWNKEVRAGTSSPSPSAATSNLNLQQAPTNFFEDLEMSDQVRSAMEVAQEPSARSARWWRSGARCGAGLANGDPIDVAALDTSPSRCGRGRRADSSRRRQNLFGERRKAVWADLIFQILQHASGGLFAGAA